MENAIVRLQEANQKESTVNENLEQDVIVSMSSKSSTFKQIF